ncbi:MAG: LamG domain-containing protein [bacterium]
MKFQRIAALALILTLVHSLTCSDLNAAALKAGVASVDVSPVKFPVIVNGGFLSAQANQVQDKLFARTIVLDDGSGPVSMTVVDSCMMPRDLLDKAKAEASRQTGIPTERMLVSATHTHTAPSAMGALGTPPDPDYVAMLPGLIAQSITRAAAKMQAARIGWTVVDDFDHTHTRRWIRRPDKMITDPFGVKNVRAHMHPGYLNPDVIGPSGPVDPALSIISVQTTDGKPLAILANYSMHYFGAKPVSADYFGVFSARIAELLGQKEGEGFVGIMSQGTSGDQHWMDYGKAKTDITMPAYAEAMAQTAFAAIGKIQYQAQAPIAMAQTTLRLTRRLPDADRLKQARETKAKMGDRIPKDIPEVYACEAIELDANPNRELILQAIRIGSIGITAIPNEVYAISGLKLKAMSPFPTTVNIELANGSEGYIPPPEQHKLGGYTTWPARTAALEVTAEPKIVETLLGLLEKVAGSPRRAMPESGGEYARKVLSLKPSAYWRLDEIADGTPLDSSGNNNTGQLEDGVALHLPGAEKPGLAAAGLMNRSAHFAGGRMKVPSLKTGRGFTVSLWFWNGMPADARKTTGILLEMPGGESITIGGRDHNPGKLLIGLPGGSEVATGAEVGLKKWHHLVLRRDGRAIDLYLDGQHIQKAEIPQGFGNKANESAYFGGSATSEFSFEGKLDEIAVFSEPLADNLVRKLGE